jgi:hypothetical protein
VRLHSIRYGWCFSWCFTFSLGEVGCLLWVLERRCCTPGDALASCLCYRIAMTSHIRPPPGWSDWSYHGLFYGNEEFALAFVKPSTFTESRQAAYWPRPEFEPEFSSVDTPVKAGPLEEVSGDGTVSIMQAVPPLRIISSSREQVDNVNLSYASCSIRGR